MKKLMILGLMLSLFAFSGNKNEIKNIYAASFVEELTTPGKVTFPSRNAETCMSKSELADYKDKIVKIEFVGGNTIMGSNTIIDITGGEYDMGMDDPIVILDSVGTSEADIKAYIIRSSDYTESNMRYDCVFYTPVAAGSNYANADASYMFAGFSALEEIDLSGLNMSNCDNLENFFMECDNLKYIKCPKSLKSGKTIQLPSQFTTYGTIGEITSDNISEYPEISITTSELKGPAVILPETIDWIYIMEQAGVYGLDNPYSMPGLSIINDYKIIEDALAKEDPNNGPAYQACEPIMIPDCTFIDASGNESIPAEGVLFAYIISWDEAGFINKYQSVFDQSVFGEDAQTIYNDWGGEGIFECYLYADVDKFYANSNSAYTFADTCFFTMDLSLLDTHNVTNMRGMFAGTGANEMFGSYHLNSFLTKLDLSNFNTSNVTDMSYMFSGCSALAGLDLSNFDTSKVTNMSYMFTGNNLTGFDLSKLNTSSVTDMNHMFSGCSSSTDLDFSNFNTSNVTNMSYMFGAQNAIASDDSINNRACTLTSLDLSSFDTSKVTDMGFMFNKCTALKKLDLSSFDTTHCSNLEIDGDITKDYFIANCTNLDYLKLPKMSRRFKLPSQLAEYYGITRVTSEILAQYKAFCIPGDEYAKKWRALRTEGGDNGICAFLTKGTPANDKLNQLLTEYDAFDSDYKEYINGCIDKEDVTVGDSITYVRNVMNGSQSTDGNYNGIKDDTGSYMTMSITEESPYLVAIISLIGILSVIGYYFYNKKRSTQNN